MLSCLLEVALLSVMADEDTEEEWSERVEAVVGTNGSATHQMAEMRRWTMDGAGSGSDTRKRDAALAATLCIHDDSTDDARSTGTIVVCL